MSTTPGFEPYVLTPLDHILWHFSLSTFYTFKLDNPFMAIPILEAGANKLISQYPFLTGNIIERRATGERKGICEVQPPSEEYMALHPFLNIKYHQRKIPSSSTGPSDSESVCTDSLYNGEFIPVPFGQNRSDLQPLLRIQANIMADGIILCASVHHRAMDAYGFFLIMKTFAAYCAGSEPVASFSPDPTDQAYARQQITKSARENLMNYGELYGYSHLCDYNGEKDESPDAPISRLYKLSAARIQRLKTICESLASTLLSKEEIEDLHNSNTKRSGGLFTQNDIVTSLIGLCGARARKQDLFSPSSLAFAANMRSFLQPSQLKNYAGNVVGVPRVSFLTQQGTDVSNSLKLNTILKTQTLFDPDDLFLLFNLALNVRRAIQSINNDYACGLISHIIHQNDWGALTNASSDITVSNLRHVPMYELDFGPIIGKPQSFDLPENRVEGVAWILPARPPSPTSDYYEAADAPWEFRLTLRQEAIDRLLQDKLFQSMCPPTSKL
ncbi:hypothetical protein BDV28DRAFT_152104 [Aspergillus coremiiformis]|uniref:Transferase family-domain-containing protein n=1 Tax=Aspergillus coremiiformis TaxID=138285 RepID=A0A5N6YVQ2_9EURO|nr:hypothetical protein BDV28DRAFT_152104 [Aspergillus coremiiformis]